MKETRDILRFSVIGSVDDGKSTLIGRLMYDSKSIMQDQYDAIEASSSRRGDGRLNLALLTDGLKAEREQGITIDVAYLYFTTPTRKFIIADCPGHIQYTRNMVTGTSSSQASLILIDVRHGVVEQTKRHAFISSMMGVKHLIVGINKMDLVDYSQEKFDEITTSMKSYLSKLDIPEVHFVPICALHGDNIVDKSVSMPWYRGPTLLYILETLFLASDDNHVDCRFPIQKVIRPMSKEWHDFRGYAGRVESGVFKPGDEVMLLPSGFQSKIQKIYRGYEEVNEAFCPMSISMTLEGDFDLSRGDMIVKKNNVPVVTHDLDLLVCWFSDKPLDLSAQFYVKHTTKETKVKIKEILYKLDILHLHKVENDKVIKMNDIARIRVRVAEPLFVDKYKINRKTGGLLLIDAITNNTVASGIVI